jgi:methenyltetrahydrofolate cyclohydrolase
MTASERPRVSESVEAFLAAVGSVSPVPAGGAAAAFCGALAAALVAMVSRVTAERDPSASSELSGITAKAAEFGQRLGGLVTDDMDAYRHVLEARRSAAGPDVVERALVRATKVPLVLARTCRDVLALCEAAAPRTRPSTLSDLGVAAALAWGALESGALTARANLADVADEAFVRASEEELAGVLAGGQEARRRVSETIAGRMRDRDQARRKSKP